MSEKLSPAAAGLDIDKGTVHSSRSNLTKVNGYEVLKFNWTTVRADIHEQLYSGVTVSMQ